VVQLHMIRRPHLLANKLAMAIAIVTICCMASKLAVRSSSSSLVASAFSRSPRSVSSSLAGRFGRRRHLLSSPYICTNARSLHLTIPPASFFHSSPATLKMTSSSNQIISDDASSPTSSSQTTPLQISSRTHNTLDPCVILMKQIISQHASKWKNDPHGIYSLAQGVVHWRPPQSAYDALSKAVKANFANDDSGDNPDGKFIHTYCPDEGYPPLLDALKRKLQKENGLHNPHVMVTAGANQAYVNCVLTFLDEQGNDRPPNGGRIRKCVVFEPYYFNHVMAVQSTRGGKNCGGLACRGVGDDAESAGEVEGLLVGPTKHGVPDLDWLRSKLEQYKFTDAATSSSQSLGNAIRMVTLVNPGNPSGVALPYSFLKAITELTKEYGVWLVMDNTYEHFDVDGMNTIEGNGGPAYPCFDEEHVINIFSFSKGYAMAGFRVGYIALSSKASSIDGGKGMGTAAYEKMLKVQDTIAICVSRLSQMAALGALEAGRDWVLEQVRSLEVGRKVILEAMEPLEEIIGGNGAMYVMGKLPNGVDDQDFASSLVEKYGVAVIPGSFCGYPGWIRVCYSNLPPDDCKLAAARLKEGILKLTSTF